jgi:hypothetical protein
MEIYRDEATLVPIVARMIVQALQIGQPALVITHPSISAKVVAELEAKGVSVDAHRSSGDLEILDARKLADDLLVDGMPDPARFKSVVGGILSKVCKGREFCFTVVYADMADLLVREGNTAAAVALEILWNRLSVDHQFSLTCGYAAAGLYRRVPTLEELKAICEQHNVVRPLPN